MELDHQRIGTVLTVDRPLSVVIDENPLAMLAYDANFTVVDANAAALALFGVTRSELMGNSIGDRIHPDDFAATVSGVAAVAADPRRDWPTILRIVTARGDAVPVGTQLRIINPAIDGVAFLVALFPGSPTYAMDKLVDSFFAGDAKVSLDLGVEAIESTGHYRASIHHTQGFTGLGRFDAIVERGIGAAIALRTAVLERSLREAVPGGEARHLPLPALGLPDEIEHGDLRLHGAYVIPLVVLDVVAGAVVVWTEHEAQLGLHGKAHVDRVAMLLGLVFGQEIERRARSTVREVGPLVIDLVERTVAIDGRIVKLTPIESTILGLLSEMPGRPVSRERIVHQLFGSTHVGESRAADVHIKNLRLKLKDDSAEQRWIVTMRGVGYALRPS